MKEILNSDALGVTGFATIASRRDEGDFGEIPRDNILFAGDASGKAGNIHGMI